MARIKRYTDRNGFLHLEGVKISRVQVAPYLGRQIDPKNALGLVPPLKPNEVYGVLRGEEELFDEEVMHGFDGMPFRVGHQMLGLSVPDGERRRVRETENAQVDGTIFNVRRSEDEPDFLLADIVIHTRRAVRAIASGVEELSLGYRCYYVPVDSYPTPRLFRGVPYLFRQVDIRANHLALVPHGRAGSDVCVYDEAIFTDDGAVITCDSLPEEVEIMEKNEEEAKNRLTALLRDGTEEQIQDCLDYCAFTDEQKAKVKELAKKAKPGEAVAKDAALPDPPPKADREDEGKIDGEGEPADPPADKPKGEPADPPADKPKGEPAEPTSKDGEGEGKPVEPVAKDAACNGKGCACGKMYTQDELDAAVRKAAEDALAKGRKDGARAQLLASAVEEDATDGKSEGDVARAACRKVPECQFAADASDDVAIAAIRANLATRANAKKDATKALQKKTLVSVDTQDEAPRKRQSLNATQFKQFLGNH